MGRITLPAGKYWLPAQWTWTSEALNCIHQKTPSTPVPAISQCWKLWYPTGKKAKSHGALKTPSHGLFMRMQPIWNCWTCLITLILMVDWIAIFQRPQQNTPGFSRSMTAGLNSSRKESLLLKPMLLAGNKCWKVTSSINILFWFRKAIVSVLFFTDASLITSVSVFCMKKNYQAQLRFIRQRIFLLKESGTSFFCFFREKTAKAFQPGFLFRSEQLKKSCRVFIRKSMSEAIFLSGTIW